MNKSRTKIYWNILEVGGVDTASDSVSALHYRMVNLVLVKDFGGGDARCACSDDDYVVNCCAPNLAKL